MEPLPPSTAYREALAKVAKPRILMYYLSGAILGIEIYLIALRKISPDTQAWLILVSFLSLGVVIGACLRLRAHQGFEREVREMGWTIHHTNLAKQRNGLIASEFR